METQEEMSRYFWSASTNCLPVALRIFPQRPWGRGWVTNSSFVHSFVHSFFHFGLFVHVLICKPISFRDFNETIYILAYSFVLVLRWTLTINSTNLTKRSHQRRRTSGWLYICSLNSRQLESSITPKSFAKLKGAGVSSFPRNYIGGIHNCIGRKVDEKVIICYNFVSSTL
jgi:hypothetical protein